MAIAARTKQAVAYGSFPLVTLALINAVQSGEPNGLSYATLGIEHEFHVSDFMVGLMPTAASVLGIPAVLLIGPISDRANRVKIIAALMGLWAAALGIASLSTFFAMLFISRMFVGALESNQPAALSLMADYYPVEKRSRVMSRFQLGGALGGAVGALAGPLTDAFGWRAAFWVWAPIGLFLMGLVMLLPDVTRGQQDVAMGAAMHDGAEATTIQSAVISALPPPGRVGTCDYANLTKRELMGELLKIKSMWYGVFSITISQILLNALSFWSPAYFERFHHLSGSGATGIISLLGVGSFAGIMLGGIIADRMLARGHVNSRIYLIVIGTVGATFTTGPAFLIHSLPLATPLFILGGFFFTLPIGPAEAMLQDVVPSELRGRANSVRSVVRAASAVGYSLVGAMSYFVGLAWALALLTPLYGLGGLIVLKARKTYGPDLAYVFAEASRTGGSSAT